MQIRLDKRKLVTPQCHRFNSWGPIMLFSFCLLSTSSLLFLQQQYSSIHDKPFSSTIQKRAVPLRVPFSKPKTALESTTLGESEASSMPTFGFVGLGIMGEGMAARLLSEGIAGQTEDSPLYIWNRTTKKSEDFKEKHGEGRHIVVAGSAKEVVEASDVTFSMLSTPAASRAVFEADDGVLAGVSSGKSIVDCATLAEIDMKNMNTAVTDAGGTFMEAPVSGSKVPAAMGALIFLCAGPKKLYDLVYEETKALQAMGKASHFFGEQVGAGTRAKLVVNSLMGTMMAAYGEGLALAESVGLDANKMIDVIGQSAIQSPVYALKGPKMIVKDHAPNFPLKHAYKDMKLASDMAKAARVEFSVMDAAENLFLQARDDPEINLADMDFSAVFEKIHRKSDSEFSRKRP